MNAPRLALVVAPPKPADVLPETEKSTFLPGCMTAGYQVIRTGR